MTDHPQLTLPVYLRDDANFSNFLFPESAQTLKSLLENQRDGGEQFIYIHGAAGSGRSHLLQAACHEGAAGSCLFLPLEELVEMNPVEVLAGLETLSLVSLDNLDAVMGRSDWEEALFHLFNRVRESGNHLLVSASVAPRQLPVGLADLQSRLSWGVVFQLAAAGDAEKLRILQFRAQQRGMSLGDEAATYILSRAGRSLGDLMQVLERLDGASMVAQRQLSIPFIREALGW